MKIAVIEKNRLFYGNYSLNNFTKDKLLDELEDYVEITDSGNILQTIHDILDMKTYANSVVETTIIFEDEKNRYEACYLSDDEKYGVNNIAIKLIHHQHRVVNKCVILKYDIINDECKLSDIYMDDILDLYYNTLVKQCVLINLDDSIHNIQFLHSPIEWINEDDAKKNIRYHEIEINDFAMMFFIELIPTNKKLNVIASKLMKKAVYGKCVLSLRYKSVDARSTENEYYNVDKEFINKLAQVNLDQSSLPDKKINNFRMMVKLRHDLLKKPLDINFDTSYESSINYESNINLSSNK